MDWKLVSWIFPAALVVAVIGCQSDSKAPQSASSPYRTVSSDPQRNTDKARELNEEALTLMEKGDLDRAADLLGRALTADVEFGPAHNNLGKVYYRKKDWYKAAWEFEYAVKLMPRRAEPHNNLGLVLEQAGELDRAVEAMRQAVSLDKTNVEYAGNLARSLLKRGDRTPEVRSLLERVATTDSRPEWVSWAKARLLQFRQ